MRGGGVGRGGGGRVAEGGAGGEGEVGAEEEKAGTKKRGSEPAQQEEAEPDTKEEADEAEGKYAGKAAPELFKECKKRGIKAAPKKPAKYYIDLLEKDDAKGGESEDEDDDWDI